MSHRAARESSVRFRTQIVALGAAAAEALAGTDQDVDVSILSDHDVSGAARSNPELVVVDGHRRDCGALVSSLVGAVPAVAVYLVCDAVDDDVRAGLDAGARGAIPRDLIAGALGGLLGARDAETDAWRVTAAPELVGDDAGVRDALAVAARAADSSATILIGGESGSGKELIARAIHRGSARAGGPFVAVNCAALPETLVEAELFGHTRGAFTGADQARAGRLVAAHGGTLFLDEIGDMPLTVQAKLLRALQERQVTPLGADAPVPVDVRVVAASHRDLAAMVDEGEFRADLYYRLGVVNIELPPLRERPGDLLRLATHFLAQFGAADGRAVRGFDRSAVRALCAHAWPGNIRELANTIHRAVVMCRKGLVSAADLGIKKPRAMPARGMAAITPAAPTPTPAPATLNLKAALESVERTLIEQALERASGNRSEAAALLGLNRTTFVEKLRKLG